MCVCVCGGGGGGGAPSHCKRVTFWHFMSHAPSQSDVRQFLQIVIY